MLGPRIPYTSTYRLAEAFRHISTHEVQEAVTERLLEFRFLGAEKEELAFSVQQLESNQRGFPETNFPQLGIDLVFDKLLLTTTLTGTLQRVLNQAELNEQLVDLQRRLSLQHPSAVMASLAAEINRLLHQPNALENWLLNSSYGFLLADATGISEQPELVVGEKKLDYFLEGYGLPLFTSSALTTTPTEVAAYTLETVGVLNAKKFNQKAFAKWLKKKVDIYDLKVVVTADFEQRYLLNRHQQVTYAEQYVAAEVPGCYSQTRARTLELLN